MIKQLKIISFLVFILFVIQLSGFGFAQGTDVYSLKDMAVLENNVQKNIVSNESMINVAVTIENKSSTSRNGFAWLGLYNSDNELIGGPYPYSFNLASGEEKLLLLSNPIDFQALGISKGNYVFQAKVNPVSGEYAGNNSVMKGFTVTEETPIAVDETNILFLLFIAFSVLSIIYFRK